MQKTLKVRNRYRVHRLWLSLATALTGVVAGYCVGRISILHSVEGHLGDYAQLVLQGDGNEAERLEILRQHEATVRRQVADLQEALGIIHHKVDLYAQRLRAGTAGELWRHGPECDAG